MVVYITENKTEKVVANCEGRGEVIRNFIKGIKEEYTNEEIKINFK